MAYIGTQPLAGQYRKLDNISSGFNGTNTSFTTSVGGINVTAGSPQQLLVSLGGVIQQPITDYTVNTSVIIFTTAPSAGLDFFAILMGDALNTSVPADGSVTSAKLAGSLNIGLGAGSVSTPSLFFSGDANTGIYSPGADQVAITTSGTGRLFIDSSGRLLVGTSTARSNFFGTTLSSLTQTEGTGGSTARGALSVINNDVSNNPPYVLLGRSGAATLGSNAAVVSGSRLGTLTFHGADGTSFIEAATVAGEVDGTPGTNDMPGRLVFSTTADGAASPTERLRITSAGLVGIGTSSPSVRLQVTDSIAGGSDNTIATLHNFSDTGGDTRYAGLNFRIGTDNGTSAIRAFRTNTATNYETNLSFWTNPAGATQTPLRAMTIDSAQRVGVGSTTPQNPLVVSNGGANGFEISSATNSGTTSYLLSYNRSTSAYTDLRFDASAFRFEVSASEKARIDSSGRLLVGTSSSLDVNAGLQIAVNSSFSDFYPLQVFHFDSTDDTQGPTTIYTRSKSDTIGTVSAVNANDGLGTILFRGAGTSAYVNGALIKAEVESGTVSNTSMPSRLVFSTTADGASSPTERMRINSDGRVFVGCASSPSASVFGTMLSNNLLSEGSKSSVNTTSANVHWVFFNPNGAVGSISTSGSATAYTTSSDYRLKENVTAVTDGITRLQQLKPSRFNFIADPDKTVDGFIAHEAQTVVPECVTGTKDEVDADGNPIYQGIDQSKLVPLLTAALQEAVAEIKALKDRVTALEGA